MDEKEKRGEREWTDLRRKCIGGMKNGMMRREEEEREFILRMEERVWGLLLNDDDHHGCGG